MSTHKNFFFTFRAIRRNVAVQPIPLKTAVFNGRDYHVFGLRQAGCLGFCDKRACPANPNTRQRTVLPC